MDAPLSFSLTGFIFAALLWIVIDGNKNTFLHKICDLNSEDFSSNY